MVDEFISSSEDEFDLAALTSWDYKHSELVGKTILIDSLHPTVTGYGEAIIVIGRIIDNADSFDNPPVSILIGALAMIQSLGSIDNPHEMIFTIGTSTAEQSGRTYYHFVTTPPKIKSMIRQHRQNR